MKEKIQEDVKVAMRAKDQLTLNTLRGLLSEFKLAEINSRTEGHASDTALTEEQCVVVLQKEVKKRRDAIEFAQKGGRADIVTQNETEIKILQKYLGEQMGPDQLKSLIQKLVTEGADNVGKIMGALNKDHKGKFEGKAASEIAKQVLEGK